MTTEVRERKFEEAIEAALVTEVEPRGTAAEHAANTVSRALRGYHKRLSSADDVDLCLITGGVIDFINATQPKMWQQFREHHGNDSREKLLKRTSREVEKRGVVDVLRGEIKESGCHFDFAYFLPASGLNPETQKLHAANMFSIVRQLYLRRRQAGCPPAEAGWKPDFRKSQHRIRYAW